MTMRRLLAAAAASAAVLTISCGASPAAPVALYAPGAPDQSKAQAGPPEPATLLDRPYAEGKALGPADAPIVIDEYADFQCPWCAKFATGALRQIEATYIQAGGGRVRLVYHNMAVLGPDSQTAAEAAECANEQGQFWPYADRLYASQQTQGLFSKSGLKQVAADIGLDTLTFDACLDSRRYQGVVEAETQAARERNIRYTPTLLVNGQTLVGDISLDQLSQIIEPATH